MKKIEQVWEQILKFNPAEKTFFKLRLIEATDGFFNISTFDFEKHITKISGETYRQMTGIISSLSDGVEPIEDLDKLIYLQEQEFEKNAKKLFIKMENDTEFKKEVNPILLELSNKLSI